MAEARKRYILLRDCVGHIQERSMLSLGRSVSTPTHLLKGELLEALPETEQPNDSTRIALAGIERKNLRLECDMEGIAKLTSEDANLLLAISSAGSRYQTYIDRKRLDFGRQIKHGSQVFVELKGVSKKLHGIVWYVGELPTNLGTMFGIELLKNPGQGTSDGTFRNKRYFTCAQDSGVFVAFDKLTPYEDTNSSSPKSQKRGESNQGNFTSKIKDAVLASFFKGSKSDQKSPRKRADYDLKIDQRVVTFVGDVPVRGNVRYIAEEKDSHGQLIVGLELDERIGSGCGRLKGKQIFIARRDFAAFVDIETVIPERDFDQTVSKLKNEGDVLDQVKRDERLARSLSHNPGCRASGGESVRKMRRTHSFESPDHEVIVAAGESSQTDCAAFIETQQKLLHECKSAKNYAPEDPDVVMSDDERTDSAGNIYFRDDHYSNSRQNSVPKISMPITKQPDLSGTKDYSDYVQIGHEDYKKQIQEHQKDRFEPVSPMETDHKVASKDYNPTGGNNIENALSTERGKNLQENAALCGDEQTSHKTTDLEAHSNVDNPYGFEVDSVVEVPMAQERPRYGVIRWIGTLSAVKGKLVAGLELDDEQSACSDGTFDGERYFTCPAGRGFFILLKHCRQDSRFTANSPISDHDYQSSKAFGSLPSEEVEGVTVPPTSLVDKFCGEMRGLQGHHNSCYLDATLYAMFAFSSVFDTLLHREQKDSDLKEYGEVQLVLREAIVNPLRTNGFVRADRILKLRKLLDELSSTAGLVNEEKDPEEFLNSLLKQVLKADPFLHLKSRDERKKDSEGAFFYQIITEKDEAVKIPRVQQLLEQSFLSADIILSEVPSCLILQMPRFGSKYKMYDMILPNLELDVTNIVENVARECTFCGSEPAQFECKTCYQKGVVADRTGMPSYCGGCNNRVHGHRDRQHHKTRPVVLPRQFQTERWMLDKQKMELFAVVCIETSHYVAFVKCGNGVDKSWCFFDSMADRKGVNVAEEPFHRRFTVVEDFESKSAVIEIHLTSIDMLVSVTVNSANKSVSSFTTAYLPGKTFTNKTEMEKVKEMDMVKVDNTNQSSNGCSITNKAWDSLSSAVKSAVKWLYIGIDWLKDTNSDAFARRTVTASDSISSTDGIVNHSMFIDVTDKDQTLTCPVASNIQLTTLTDSKPDSKSFSKKSEDGKVNTALPATSMENIETNVTSSSGTAEKEVNVIMANATNKRREPIVVFIGHSDREELSKDESSELPKFTSSSFLGLHPEIRSSNRQENDHVMFPGVMGYYGIASHKTVQIPEYHDTVASLDREEDEISTALGMSSTEKTYPKENGLALRQKDTEIGTFALLDGPQSTLKNESLSGLVDTKNQTTNFNSEKADERSEDVKIVIDTLISSNDTKEDLSICPNQPLTGGSSLNKVHSGVCMKDGERLGLRIDDLPSLTTQYQDITFLRGSTAKQSRSRWMTKLVKDESTHAFYITGLNQSGTECCSKKTSPSVDSSWFITRLWNRGLVSVGLRKPSSVTRKTAKRPQYQRLTDVPISVHVFEICMTEINQTGPETLYCTKKAARRQAESESFTTKLWIKGVEFVGWIRSNETQEKAWNLANIYLTKFLTKMINWTWQDTFDMMTMILATECCYTAMYLAIPLIINIIKSFIRMLIRKWRLYRKNRQQQLEKELERLRQEELARERAARPKPWRPKQPRKRKINFCGRLQKW